MPIMEEISFFFQTFLFNLGLMLNICIAWDLYLIIRFPFQSPESRYFKYYMLSIFVSLIPATVRLMTLHTDEYMAYSYLNLGIMIAYASIGMFSSIYAFYMLSGPGVSTQVKQLLLRRHIFFIVLFFLCNLHNIISSLWYAMHTPGED